MFAVIKTGGKQYRVAADDVIRVETLAGEAGDAVKFDALMVGDGSETKIGAPLVDGVTVSGEIVEQTRDKKKIAFYKRRRHNSRRTRGHRQHITVVKITAIGGETAKPKRTRKAKAAAETEGAEAAAPAEAQA
ncbi:MAG: 50S ribosomal protein L21 [Bauldia sp.]|nr:50S ribosomal protein L21 [Bauldia sp.]